MYIGSGQFGWRYWWFTPWLEMLSFVLNDITLATMRPPFRANYIAMALDAVDTLFEASTVDLST